MYVRSRSAGMTLGVMLTVLAACRGEPSLTAPIPNFELQQSALRAELVTTGSDAQAAIEDALARNVPALEDPLAAAPLQAALAALHEHIEDGNYEAARGAVTAAHRGLAAYQRKVGSQGADAADLDAVQLALENPAWAGASLRP